MFIPAVTGEASTTRGCIGLFEEEEEEEEEFMSSALSLTQRHGSNLIEGRTGLGPVSMVLNLSRREGGFGVTSNCWVWGAWSPRTSTRQTAS